ncbi:hypothetical protein Pint_25973 [Pistacia integerrima]|jgi:hypothetical protein
MSLG